MKYGILAVVVGMAGLAQQAEAKTYIEYRSVSSTVATYCKTYVPATVAVNTRGRLARGPKAYWVESPTTFTRVREPAVFFTTTRLVEPDHYTLTPC